MNRYVSVEELLNGIFSDNPKDVMLYIANFPYTDMPLMNGDTLVLDHSKANEIERVIVRSDGSGWCFQKGSGDVEMKWLENKDGTKDIIYSHKEVRKIE